MDDLTPQDGQAVPTQPAPPIAYDTINEPVSESLLRDLRSIVRKLSVVLIPSRKNEFEKELKNCMKHSLSRYFIFHLTIIIFVLHFLYVL